MATDNFVVKERPYTLTSEEKNALGNQLLGLLNDEDALARDKKASNANFKAREEALSVQIVKLREKASTGIEMRKYKCYERRDAATNTVNTVVAEGPNAGQIIDSRPFNSDDWEKEHNLFSGLENSTGPDEDEIRNPAPTEPEEEQLEPNRDEMGNVVAGPETDAFNMKYADSPYQHLSEHIAFEPAIPSFQAEDAAAAQTTSDGEQSTKPVLFANHDEMGNIIDGPETELYNEVLAVATMQDDSVEALLLAMSQEEVTAKLAQLDQYDQEPQSAIEFYATALRGVLASADDSTEADEEASATDEPQPNDAPKPKRAARKRKPKTDEE